VILDPEQDLCDYPMSDTAICEARRVGLAPGLPYSIGWHRKAPPQTGRPSLKAINALPDEQFRKFIQNGCKFPGEERPDESASALKALRTRLEITEAVVRTLQRQVSVLAGLARTHSAKTVQGACGPVRGLDIEPR
jgi:hypothetical protein